MSFPAIQKRFLRRKTQNFAVKSNSKNHFTLVQKNSECAAPKNKRKMTKTAKIFHLPLAILLMEISFLGGLMHGYRRSCKAAQILST